MNAVQGTPVNINGRTGGTPGPAPSTGFLRVQVPVPPGRQRGGSSLTQATTTFSATSNDVPTGSITFLDVLNIDAVVGQLVNRIWLGIAASAADAACLAIILEFPAIP